MISNLNLNLITTKSHQLKRQGLFFRNLHSILILLHRLKKKSFLQPIESTPGPVSQLPMKRYFYQVQNETQNSMSAPRPSNRDLLRSGGNRQHHRK